MMETKDSPDSPDASPQPKRHCVETPPMPENAAGRLGGTWWCMDCEHAAFAVCMEKHDVSRPAVALRRSLFELKEEHQGQTVWEHADPERNDIGEENILTALRLLRTVPTTCKLIVQQDGCEDLSVEWRVDNPHEKLPYSLAYFLLKPALVALAARGELQEDLADVETDPPSSMRVSHSPETCDNQLDMRALDPATALSHDYPYHPSLSWMLCCVRDHGLRRLAGVYCSGGYNSGWVLELLQHAAPTLVDLELFEPLEEHVCATVSMPRLRRLAFRAGLDTDTADLKDNVKWKWSSPEMTALPAMPHPSRLHCLRIEHFPASTIRALLRTYGASLEELQVPFRNGLVRLLGECRLPRLSKLLLVRVPSTDHTNGSTACTAEVALLMGVLPGCNVQCEAKGCSSNQAFTP